MSQRLRSHAKSGFLPSVGNDKIWGNAAAVPTILSSPIVIPSVARNLLYARGICASAVEVSHAKSGFLPSVGMTRFGETIGVEIGRLVKTVSAARLPQGIFQEFQRDRPMAAGCFLAGAESKTICGDVKTVPLAEIASAHQEFHAAGNFGSAL